MYSELFCRVQNVPFLSAGEFTGCPRRLQTEYHHQRNNGDEFTQDFSTVCGSSAESMVVVGVSEVPVHPDRDSSNN